MAFAMGKDLAAARMAVGQSQEGTAQALSITPQTLRHWESEAAVPSLRQLGQLSKVLGAPPEMLVGMKPKRKRLPLIGQRDQAKSVSWGATSDELRRLILAKMISLSASLTADQAAVLQPVLEQHYQLLIQGVTAVAYVVQTMSLAVSKVMRQAGMLFSPAQEADYMAIVRADYLRR
ncbi:helix-turn-helix transcriptional regulator [Lacticaseibacillus jixianensis]|uniref:Helix-turn-helix transcriptional regulator n=1 Tax=Lacticaseibacillus jixianensis TaxID=2486012 RepID=A0ABW4B9F4_9LACO|nr:helix-turn-helix transcriptional regulator [Lacticaseibacillus jixianensis]